MRGLVISFAAMTAFGALPAAAEDSNGFLTFMRVGTSVGVCREKVKAAYPGKNLALEQFKIDAKTDAKGERLVRYTGFTQEPGQARVPISGVCHIRKDGPSTIEIDKAS
jgi:hypothetical protein